MASPSTPASAQKTMSSRLLTMKFMQRAAASSPGSPSPSTPEEPPNKRRKKDIDSSSPNFNVDALVDQHAIQKAVAEEDAKRQAALDKQAAEAGDTKWVLSFKDEKRSEPSTLALRVVPTGYANLDRLAPFETRSVEEGTGDKPIVVGRRSFGKFNRRLEKNLDPSAESSSGSESDKESNEDDEGGSSDSDSADPIDGLIGLSRDQATHQARKERRAKKKAEGTRLNELAKERKKKDVNLNRDVSVRGLTSLSGQKGPAPTGKGPCHHCRGPHMKRDCPELPAHGDGPCFVCGGPHFKASCPQQKRNHPGGDDGPPRKVFKTR